VISSFSAFFLSCSRCHSYIKHYAQQIIVDETSTTTKNKKLSNKLPRQQIIVDETSRQLDNYGVGSTPQFVICRMKYATIPVIMKNKFEWWRTFFYLLC